MGAMKFVGSAARLGFCIGLTFIAPSRVTAQGVFDKGGALSIDKPFDKGGGLSIDKPFDKGGSLSIDKPFDKGGSLSINKVYVPRKLQIGRVHSIWEIIIPVCWGAPQDCRGTSPEKSKEVVKNETKQYPYYITARFVCRNKTTGAISGKQCDVTKASENSCTEALAEITTISFDPCSTCADISDPSEYWDGASPQHVQDGRCVGW